MAPTEQSNHFRFYGKIHPVCHGAESFSVGTTQEFLLVFPLRFHFLVFICMLMISLIYLPIHLFLSCNSKCYACKSKLYKIIEIEIEIGE